MHSTLTPVKRVLAMILFIASIALAMKARAAESDLREEMEALRQMMLEQQQTIRSLSEEVASLKQQLSQEQAHTAAGPTLRITPPQEGEPSLAANESPLDEHLPLEEAPLKPEQESWLSFKHNDWSFEVYGYVMLDAAYDTQQTFNGDFARYVLPQSSSPDDQLSFTARQTRLGFNVRGPAFDDWKPGARIETDFYGDYSSNTPTLRLRLAYADLQNDNWHLTVGQDWDALVVALPKTVNFAVYYNQGALWSRRPQIKAEWTHPVGDGTLKLRGAVAGAESGDIDGGGQPDGDDSGVPNFEGTVAYEFPVQDDLKATVALGGAWGREAFHIGGGAEKNYDTAVGMFTGILDWKNKAKLLGSVWAGKNVAGFGGGIGQSVNLALMTPIASRGGWVQLQTFPADKWNWNVAFGLDDPVDSDLSPGMRSFNMDASTSLFYQVTSYLTLALEYSFLKTDYYRTQNVDSHRIQTSVALEF